MSKQSETESASQISGLGEMPVVHPDDIHHHNERASCSAPTPTQEATDCDAVQYAALMSARAQLFGWFGEAALNVAENPLRGYEYIHNYESNAYKLGAKYPKLESEVCRTTYALRVIRQKLQHQGQKE